MFITQQVGDRGHGYYSFHNDHSFTIPANPMSDRGQLVVEVYTLPHPNIR